MNNENVKEWLQLADDDLYSASLCIEINMDFQNIKTLCSFLNRFVNDIRYPHKYEVTEKDVAFSINAVETIKNIKPMIDIRNIINKI
ncbi:MAG: hypothetical protein LBD59_00905 [Prevotellaceae bacterium]|jgi:hypothetical protein|nr:hypothetical protein [Prevotellaceae bacterium]